MHKNIPLLRALALALPLGLAAVTVITGWQLLTESIRILD